MAASACVSRLVPAPSSFIASTPDSSSFSPHSVSFSRCKFALRNGAVPKQTGDSQRGNLALRINCMEHMLGDFGARDPFAEEIESNFGDKVLGNAGTEHIILIPPSLLGLSEKSCQPLAPGTKAFTEAEAKTLIRKVVGWRITSTDQGLKIQCEWNLRDFGSGITLLDRIAVVASAEEHYPELHLERGNKVRAECSTPSIGGLCENDFILAAKIDKIQTSDLVKKTRFWA